MKKGLYVISCIAMCAVFIFSGCNVIKTEISNPITEIFDEGGVDYKSFSEPAQKALYRIYSNHFFEAICMDEDDLIEKIEEVEALCSLSSSNSSEKKELLDARFEDVIIRYDICIANANALAVCAAAAEYSYICSDKGIEIKPGTYFFKLASESSEKEVKFNGSNRDLKLFLNDVINIEARNGYCCIEINDYSEPTAAYWAESRATLSNVENLKSSYVWSIKEYQEGMKPIGAYPVTYSITDSVYLRTAEEINHSSILDLFYNAAYEDSDNDEETYENLSDIFIDEINEWESYFESFESETSDVTYTKDQYDNIKKSNAEAKQVHIALSSCATQASIYDIKIENAEITNNYDGDTDLLFGDYDPDLESYLGESFKGYYYVYLNPETYSVYFALWSEQPIPDSYKHQLSEDEQKKLWANDIRIGCYPLLSDTDMKIEEQHIDKNSSNANAKMVHTALSACATQAAIMDVEINDSEITNNYDGDVDLLFGDYDPELVSYLGDSFKGYYYVYLNTDTYSVYFALWSEQPIPDSYKYQFTEQEQIKLWEDGVRIGCYPLASN